MKKFSILAFIAIALLAAAFFSGCESPKTISHGIPDVGYVQFVSSTKYKSVKVIFDNEVTINAKVNDPNDRTIDNDSNYAVTSGRHSLEVFDSKGNSILVKDIFVSTQEIRTVYLP